VVPCGQIKGEQTSNYVKVW